MKKLFAIHSYVKHHGWRWIWFRLKYERRKRSACFDRHNRRIIARADSALFVKTATFNKITNPAFTGDKRLLEAADNAINGKIFAFSHEYLDYSHNGKVTDWHYNPVNGKNAPAAVPWHRLPDFGEYGDIKLIWEASRFPQVYYFINAYAVSRDGKYAAACLEQICNWCTENPFPYGVNYKCGQEIAFRLFAWITATGYFRDFAGPEFFETLVKNIYISLLRIDMNIDYAAESVRNNHSVSEAAGLFVGGLLFPQFPESRHFIKRGLHYLVKELAYQVYPDGSYIQHSMIYHRLVLDVLSFVIMIAAKNTYELPPEIKAAHRKLLLFLYSFCNADGKAPNYGTNDGSRLFPVSGAGYSDFRESLNFAAAVNYGKRLFDSGLKTAELFNQDTGEKLTPERKTGFPDGGYYLLKNRAEDIFLMTRCHSHRHRPGQADMLHLDVWYRGRNIFSDSGTYSYNPESGGGEDFSGTPAHNTVTVNGCCQMPKVSRFGFGRWTKSKLIAHSDNTFIGEHYGYRKRFGVIHRRHVTCSDKQVIIEDRFLGMDRAVKVRQNWNTVFDIEQNPANNEFSVAGCRISSDCPGHIEAARNSEYYNHCGPSQRLVFEAEGNKDFRIITRIDFI
ncbi:MAG: alginate lyase family protein [Victivallales bacterium]|nr:alginate lyase family protein [Victivallales bacterium]